MEDTTTQLRRDASRNRNAIVAAARELFADSADVTMCEIARRAGVGQATLYRNFPDRQALAAELLGEIVERTEALAQEWAGDPDAFFVLMRNLAEGMADLYVLGELGRADACIGSRLEQSRRQVVELLRRPLADAKAAGTLRRDLSLDDLFLVLLMTRGAMSRADGSAARAAAAGRALELVLNGLMA